MKTIITHGLRFHGLYGLYMVYEDTFIGYDSTYIGYTVLTSLEKYAIISVL